MPSYFLSCSGDILELNDKGEAKCRTEDKESGWILSESAGGSSEFDFSQIDPATASLLFGTGFFLTLLPIATAFGFRILLQAITTR